MSEELKLINCGCGGEASMCYGFEHRNIYAVECAVCGICTCEYDTKAEAIEVWNRAMGITQERAIDFLQNTGWMQDHDRQMTEPKERMAKVIRNPQAFFYHCECGYSLCCEKNDMNYCPNCGCRLEWK